MFGGIVQREEMNEDKDGGEKVGGRRNGLLLGYPCMITSGMSQQHSGVTDSTGGTGGE